MPWELLGRTRLKQMLAFGSVFCLGVVVGTGFLVSVESRTVFSFPSPGSLIAKIYILKCTAENQKAANSTKMYK